MVQLIKPQIKWTPEKIQLLKDEYPLGNKDLLAEKLQISRLTLKYAAKRFKVKSKLDIRSYNLKILKNNSCISLYWHGFIMADGYVNKNGQVKVALSKSDDTHLIALYNYVNSGSIKNYTYPTTYNSITHRIDFTCSDIDFCNYYLELYSIISPKTYNPPNLKSLELDKKLFISFLIGLIDGDGCIDYRKSSYSLKIELYKNWFDNLKWISEKLFLWFGIESNVKISSRGYAILRINKTEHVNTLKRISLELNLPILKRKWDLVSINFISKKNIIRLSIDKICMWLTEGWTLREISTELGIKENTLKTRLKERKII